MNYVNLKPIQKLNKVFWVNVFLIFLILSICLSFYTSQQFQNLIETNKNCESLQNVIAFCGLGAEINFLIAITANLIFNIIILILNSQINLKQKSKANLFIHFLYFINWLSFTIFYSFSYDSLFFNILILQVLAFVVILGNLGILFWQKSQEIKNKN